MPGVVADAGVAGMSVDVTPSAMTIVFETTTVLTTSSVLLIEPAGDVPETFKDARKSLMTSLFVDEEVPRMSLELDGVLVVTVLLRTWRFTCRGK
jgi:hypothetical protein